MSEPAVGFYGDDVTGSVDALLQFTRRGWRGRLFTSLPSPSALADAAAFDPAKTFGSAGYDRIFISYAVSMIPQWRMVVADAARRLLPGGELHVADFGDMAGFPSWFKTSMHAWLRWHHVTPRPDLFEAAAEIAASLSGASQAHRLHRDFSWIAIVRKPAA